MVNIDEIFAKYGKKIEREMREGKSGDFSREYLQFKKEMAPDLSRYEKWCKSLGNIIKLKLAAKDEIRIQKQLNIAHLDVTPSPRNRQYASCPSSTRRAILPPQPKTSSSGWATTTSIFIGYPLFLSIFLIVTSASIRPW